MKFKVERICCTGSMSAIPMNRVRFDLAASAEKLRDKGYEVEPQELYLVVKAGELDVSIYSSGRVLIHPMDDKNKAKEFAQTIFDLMVPE